MWFERFVIILSSPGHEFDPYSWGLYFGPTWVEYGILIGSFSLFFLLFLLFAKFLPTISMTELKDAVAAPRRRRATVAAAIGPRTGEAPMSNKIRLLAVFAYLDDLLAAIRTDEAAGPARSSTSNRLSRNREIAALMKERPSPVRFFTLTGGILGILSGYGLAVYTAWQWSFVVSGKPPIPLVPYVISLFRVLHPAFGVPEPGRAAPSCPAAQKDAAGPITTPG